MRNINKGLILAAGDGSRLGSPTLACPKVLLPVNDKAIISYPIEALLAAGISEIAIVVGYLGDKVSEVLGSSNFGARLQYISNSDYLGGNAISVYKARDWAQGAPIVLCMGDTLIEKTLVKRLLDRKTLTDTLCIDYTPAQHQLGEATKVTVNSGRIGDIGKNLAYWDAVDTGVFLLTESFFEAVHELVHHLGHLGIAIEITDVVRFLISRGHRFDACDVSGCFWADVDTEQDLNMVRDRIKKKMEAVYDGYVSKYINRKISEPVARRLAKTKIPPNQMTWVAFGIALLSFVSFVFGQNIVGGLLAQLSSIVDGADA